MVYFQTIAKDVQKHVNDLIYDKTIMPLTLIKKGTEQGFVMLPRHWNQTV